MVPLCLVTAMAASRRSSGLSSEQLVMCLNRSMVDSEMS